MVGLIKNRIVEIVYGLYLILDGTLAGAGSTPTPNHNLDLVKVDFRSMASTTVRSSTCVIASVNSQ